MAALSDFHRTKSGSDRHTSHAAMEQFQDNKWKNFAIQETIHILRHHFLEIHDPPPARPLLLLPSNVIFFEPPPSKLRHHLG